MSAREDIMQLVKARHGHFVLESGHHGELWLDLETLFLNPTAIRPLAIDLADQITDLQVDVICGPLIEGAFVGLMVAEIMSKPFVYTNPQPAESTGMFPVNYDLPAGVLDEVASRRVAIVNDVINAGSAIRGTFESLVSHDAKPVAVASLLTLGNMSATLAQQWQVEFITLASLSNRLWLPTECPFCAGEIALDDPT